MDKNEIQKLLNKMFENQDAVYCCDVCTHHCYAWTGSIIPNQCLRSDLDVSEKSKWHYVIKIPQR